MASAEADSKEKNEPKVVSARKSRKKGTNQTKVNSVIKKDSKGKKRVRVKYDTTLNYDALKKLENTTVASCLELVKKVILIDGIPFKDARYKNTEGKELSFKLTSGRKNDFLRLIEHHAEIKFIGIKCHIVKVFNKDERDKIGDIFLQKRIDKVKHS